MIHFKLISIKGVKFCVQINILHMDVSYSNAIFEKMSFLYRISFTPLLKIG